MTPIEQIKERTRIEDLVGEDYTLTGRGAVLSTKEHDSLKIWPRTQTWHRFSTGEGGDIFDYYMWQHKCDFRTALEDLARKAGVELRQITDSERQAAEQQRCDRKMRHEILAMAAAHFHAQLLVSPEAIAYCTKQRGWTLETIEREQIGFNPENPSGDNKPLSAQLRFAGLIDHPLAKAVLSIPTDMIVYVHSDERGLPVYLSARNIVGKRHFNLPDKIEEPPGSGNWVTAAGPKQPYINAPAPASGAYHVLVEGQADAISLGQLGVRSTALCGAADAQIPDVTHIAYDNDHAGQEALTLALTRPERAVEPLARIVTWPATIRHRDGGQNHIEVKDANDYARGATTPDDLHALLANSPTALQVLAMRAGKAKDDERQALIKRFFDIFTSLDNLVATDLKPDLANRLCNGSLGQFSRLLKAYQANKSNEGQDHSERHLISAGGYMGGYLFEQCVQCLDTSELKTFYWVRTPDNKFEKVNALQIGPTMYWPVDPREEELISGGDVLFPSDREPSGTETELLRDIRAFIHRWLDVPAYYENIASYYVLLTWFYDAGYETLPYLRALGEYGSGKTRFIKTIGSLCYRAMMFGGGDSEATIYYTLELFKGTTIVDESDFKSSDESALIAKIINLGNSKHGSIKRMEPKSDNSGLRVRRFNVFGPKIFGAREGFMDQAMDSRCITHYTTKGLLRPDIPLDLTEEFYTEAQRLRNRLLDYRLKYWQPVTVDPNDVDRTIMARLAQITLALRSIIKDKQILEDLQRFMQLYNQSLISDRQTTDPAIVVEALVRIRYPRPSAIPVPADWSIANIAAVAKEILANFDPDVNMTPKRVGQILRKQLGIIRRGKRDLRGRDTIIIDDDELFGLMQRYGISKPDYREYSA